MRKVNNVSELKDALKNRESVVYVANKHMYNALRVAIWIHEHPWKSTALVALLAVPSFASGPTGVAGAAAFLSTRGLTISTADLAIIAVTIVTIVALYRNYNADFALGGDNSLHIRYNKA